MSSLESEQQSAKTLAEIGAHLRDVRQEKAMDLDEISAQTLIPTRLLKAIEEGQVQELPELIYTRGMIRRFANTLGLDGAKLVADLGGQQTIQKNLAKPKRSSGGGLKPIHLYVLYIVVIVAAGSGLSYMINQSALTLGGGSGDAPSGTEAPEDSSQPEALAPAVPAAVSSKPPASPKPTAPLRIDLSVKQDAWVEIVIDGETSYSGTLTAGTNRTVTAQKKLVLRSGNAGGLLVAVNQKPAQIMGKPGAVEEIVLEPDATDQSAAHLHHQLRAALLDPRGEA